MLIDKSSLPADTMSRIYTLGEVANYLVVREDDLNALLLDTEIAVEARPTLGFTWTDVEIMERFIFHFQEFIAESVYGGGEL